MYEKIVWTGFCNFFTDDRFILFQTEIAKRLNAIIAQILPFLSQEHQQQVATAVERAKQVTMTELNAIIGVSTSVIVRKFWAILTWRYGHYISWGILMCPFVYGWHLNVFCVSFNWKKLYHGTVISGLETSRNMLLLKNLLCSNTL